MRDYAGELRAIAENVAARCAADERVEAVLLTGSVALGRCDAASDIDMTIYYRDLPDIAELEGLVAAEEGWSAATCCVSPQ